MVLPADDLRVEALSAGYGDRRVVNALTLAPMVPGQVLSLLGPNAAGKSTLLRALAGLLPATGRLSLGNTDLLGLSLAAHSRLVTYMPQTLPQRVALSVLEAVVSALRASPADGVGRDHAAITGRALDVLDRVGIRHLALDGLDRLSGGQRQLASLAQAIVRQPRVLLLDEPTSALDLRYQLKVMKLVRELARERGMIVVMVLHDLGLAARWSDRIVVLSQGELAAEGVPAVAITPEVLARVYGVAARIETCSQGVLQVIVDDDLEATKNRVTA